MYFRFLGEKLFISENSRRRFAPPDPLLPHRRRLGSGAEADPGRGRLLADEGGPGDLRGDHIKQSLIIPFKNPV
jgi:hypothetical protein